MKCPHCEKPVHVAKLVLNKGRKPFLNKVTTMASYNSTMRNLSRLIRSLKGDGMSYTEIAKRIGVTAPTLLEKVRKFEKLEESSHKDKSL